MAQADKYELLQITEQFVAEQEAGQHPSMAEYIRRYPQYTDELVDFVTYYYAMEADLPQEEIVTPPLSAHSRAALQRGWAQAEALTADDSALLLTLARYQHGSLPRLAVALDLSVDIVTLLVDRRLDPITLPSELVRRLAQVLAQPLDRVRPTLGIGIKEMQKKQMIAELPFTYVLADRQSFRHVLQDSTLLSSAQRERWLLVLDGEGL